MHQLEHSSHPTVSSETIDVVTLCVKITERIDTLTWRLFLLRSLQRVVYFEWMMMELQIEVLRALHAIDTLVQVKSLLQQGVTLTDEDQRVLEKHKISV